MRPMSSSSWDTHSEIRAAVGISGREANSSTLVQTLRSVSKTEYICSNLFRKSPQLQLFLIAVFSCCWRNFFLRNFLVCALSRDVSMLPTSEE